jgi:Senescence-associated protein
VISYRHDSCSTSGVEFNQCRNLFDSFVSLGVPHDDDTNVVVQGLVFLAMVGQMDRSRLCCGCDSCYTTTTATSSSSVSNSVRSHATIQSDACTSSAAASMIQKTTLHVQPTSGRVRDMVARMENNTPTLQQPTHSPPEESDELLNSAQQHQKNKADQDTNVAAAKESFYNAIDTVGEYLATGGGSTTIQHRKNVLGHLLRVGLLSRDKSIDRDSDDDEERLDQLERIFWSSDWKDMDSISSNDVIGNGIIDCCWFWQLRAVTQHAMRQEEKEDRQQQQQQQQQVKRRLLAIQQDSHQLVTSIAEVAGLLEETVLETTLHVCRGIDETGSWLIQHQQSEPKLHVDNPSKAEQASSKELSPSKFCWYNDKNAHCEGQQKENDICRNWMTPTKSTPLLQSNRVALLEDRKNQVVYETYSGAARRATTAAHNTVSRALTATKDASRLGMAKAAQAFVEQGLGEKLVADEDHRTVLAAVANVGLVSLGAIAVVGDACMESTSRVLQTAGTVTANVVEHKYGPSAGRVIRDGGEAVLNIWKTLALVKFVAPHVLTKILAKETGKRHLRRKQEEADSSVESSKNDHHSLAVPEQQANEEVKQNHAIQVSDSRASKTVSFQLDCQYARCRHPVNDRVIAAKKEICDWISDCPCSSTSL